MNKAPDEWRAPGLGTLEARLEFHARDFDIPALLYVLGQNGYEPQDIAYRGHMSASPQPSLVHALRFYEHAGRPRVEITLNLGLVSCRTPLPAYFSELLHHVDTADALRDLIEFLDNKLLAERCQSYRPERFRSEWPLARADMLSLVDSRAPNQVHSLFQYVFPELEVSVDRGAGSARVRVGGTRVGYAVLGNCAFGSYAQAPTQGLHVVLCARSSHSYAGVPWRAEAAARCFGLVLPFLRRTDMYLWVELILALGGRYLQLDGESSIGYEPLIGGQTGPYRVTLFRGRLKPTALEDAGTGAQAANVGAYG